MTLPLEFIRQAKSLFIHEADSLLEALENKPSTSVRFNPVKFTKHLPFERIGWARNAYYLPERPQFTLDPFFHAGAYYVQESSSMFLEHIIKELGLDKRPLHALDLCAAPGGKSSLLMSALHPDSVLVANEIVKTRANVLSENLQKWGNPNIITCNNNSHDFAMHSFQFDLVLVDAPCSGEGMFRKDHSARNEWSVQNVFACAERQKEIIKNIWGSLKPGGCLIYSTCTFNTAENEELVSWMLHNYDADCCTVNLDEFDGISVAENCDTPVYRFLPHRVKGEGFAVSVIKKGGRSLDVIKNAGKQKVQNKTTIGAEELKLYESAVSAQNGRFIEDYKGVVHYISEALMPVYEQLSKLRIVHAGVSVGSVKKKKLVPFASFAFSGLVEKEAFPIVSVELDVALRYFKRESLILQDAPRGWVLLEYEGLPIGFVNNLGSRANNTYVPEWKIKMNLPESLPTPFWRL